jgi:hypothetical protein
MRFDQKSRPASFADTRTLQIDYLPTLVSGLLSSQTSARLRLPLVSVSHSPSHSSETSGFFVSDKFSSLVFPEMPCFEWKELEVQCKGRAAALYLPWVWGCGVARRDFGSLTGLDHMGSWLWRKNLALRFFALYRNDETILSKNSATLFFVIDL